MLFHWCFINWFGMITLQAVSRVTQTPSRHLPNTSKSINVGVVKGFVIKVCCCCSCYSINTVLAIYPGTLRHHPESLQTPSRHYPITSVFSMSVKPNKTVCYPIKSVQMFFWGLQFMSWHCEGWGWGRYDVKSIDNNPIRIILISWFPFSQLPRSVWRVSGRCLRGFWEVSRGSVSDSGYCLGGWCASNP